MDTCLLPNTTIILINQYFDILYSNVNNQDTIHQAIDYFKLKILEHNVGKMEKIYEDFLVCTDDITINDCNYSLTTIERIRCLNSKEKHYLQFKDTMTGLYNRSYLEHMLKYYYHLRSFDHYTVMMVDADNLKNINDLEGHLQGDRAIKCIANAILAGIRETDIAIRYGGDEFLLILPNCNKSGSQAAIHRIHKSLNSLCKQTNFNISVSIGCSYTNKLNNLNHAIKQADLAMYQEKKIKKYVSNTSCPYLDVKDQMESMRLQLMSLLKSDFSSHVTDEILLLSQQLDDLISKLQKGKQC